VKFGELKQADEWQRHWDSEAVMVVAVPLSVSKRALKGAFAQLLDSRHTGSKSGRPSLAKLKTVSTARYKLEHNYTISGLLTTLAVYDLWVENQTKSKEERLTLWGIGKALNINKPAIKDAESQFSADRLVGRNVLGATVSRYVKQAKAMTENAAAGMRDIYAVVFEPVICLVCFLKVFCVHTFIYQRLKKELANLARYLVFWAD